MDGVAARSEWRAVSGPKEAGGGPFTFLSWVPDVFNDEYYSADFIDNPVIDSLQPGIMDNLQMNYAPDIHFDRPGALLSKKWSAIRSRFTILYGNWTKSGQGDMDTFAEMCSRECDVAPTCVHVSSTAMCRRYRCFACCIFTSGGGGGGSGGGGDGSCTHTIFVPCACCVPAHQCRYLFWLFQQDRARLDWVKRSLPDKVQLDSGTGSVGQSAPVAGRRERRPANKRRMSARRLAKRTRGTPSARSPELLLVKVSRASRACCPPLRMTLCLPKSA